MLSHLTLSILLLLVHLLRTLNSGERYITVASHRFPYGDKVFLPCASGNEIAQISMEITHRNVVIAKWEKGAGYRWSDSIGYGH